METTIEKPEGLTEDHLEYLDELRGTGRTNMLGAGVYLEGRFGIDYPTAKAFLAYWMKTYRERHKEEAT